MCGRKIFVMVCFVLVGLMGVAVEAQSVIPGVTVLSSSEFLWAGVPFYKDDYLVDGSGMTGDLHGTAADTMWLTNTGEYGSNMPHTHPAATNDYYWLEFNLGQVSSLGEMWVWNYGSVTAGGDYTARGLKDVYIKTSTDGVNWSLFAGPGYDSTHQFGKTNTTPGVSFAHNTTIDFGGLNAKYVLVYSSAWVPDPVNGGYIVEPEWGAYQGAWGLSEARFHAVPEPATMMLLGVGGLLLRRKKSTL